MLISKDMQEIEEGMSRDLGVLRSVTDSWLKNDGEWSPEGIILKITNCESRIKAGITFLEEKGELQMKNSFKKELGLLQEDIKNIFQEKQALQKIFTKGQGLFTRLDILTKDFKEICRTLNSDDYGAHADDKYILSDSAEEFFVVFAEMVRLAYFSNLTEHQFFQDWKKEFDLLEEKVKKNIAKFTFMRDFLKNSREAEFNQKEFSWIKNSAG
jgi:hypothetical protein